MNLSQRQRRYLDIIGVDIWASRAGSRERQQSDQAPDGEDDIEQLGWDELRQAVACCTRCELHESRSRTVFGIGSPQADCLIVGEAPGAEEDRQGEPFVGPAGQLLNEMLAAIGLHRPDVFIANILKCRPPRNRDPRPEEAACCEPFLRRQISLLEPRVILAVGRVAAQRLLGTDSAIGTLRGRCHRYGDPAIPLIVTYHPAYLLRSPLEKRKAWVDLQLAREVLAERRNGAGVGASG